MSANDFYVSLNMFGYDMQKRGGTSDGDGGGVGAGGRGVSGGELCVIRCQHSFLYVCWKLTLN